MHFTLFFVVVLDKFNIVNVDTENCKLFILSYLWCNVIYSKQGSRGINPPLLLTEQEKLKNSATGF